MSCSHCGAAVLPSSRFCPGCGHPLDVDAEATLAPADRAPSSSSGWLLSSDSISHGRFAPGSVINARYRVIALIGKGGMGEVYRADDLRLGQTVALKFLPNDVARDPVRLAQFHNEVRAARHVSHPNICRVYDIGEVDGQLFISMEFVGGEDLATSLRRIGRFPEDKATEIARQLCAGLAAAHQRGVVHRDLKPANVMLDEGGAVRVMDFGLAGFAGIDESRAGTPAYMAPEQLLGQAVTVCSDIYALGLVLYELFTGRRARTGTTLNELIEQHQSGQVTLPRTLVAAIDPAIERAILRCLEPNPERRPASALAVAAALAGGDPLAAALAAGETPSPEMVAAAGEGVGLRRNVALPVFVAVLAGMAASYAMTLRLDPLERMRPEYNADVLLQKGRDALRAIGFTDRPRDEAYGFTWDESVFSSKDAKNRRWAELVRQRPSPLLFWYRRSPEPLTGSFFHHDLLTPGIVDPDDPPPIRSGMIALTVDHQGFITALEAIPPQVEETPPQAAAADWTPLLKLAGLEEAALQRTTPQWNWLAAADERAAWTGTWPGTDRPLRVEAAALHGRPVALQLIGPSTKPSRSASGDESGQIAIVVAYFILAIAVVFGGTLLARDNLRAGRGDRDGALRLAAAVTIALIGLWLCQVHFTPSIGLIGVSLLAVVTAVFYGVLFWTIYLALEPSVRRHWPQTLVSWTTLLRGRARDAVVGRDVLFGVALGLLIAVLIRATVLQSGDAVWPAPNLLLGVRSLFGYVIMQSLYAVRSALFFFYLLFLLRLLLRNQWAAAVAFALMFAGLDALDSDTPWLEGVQTFVYFSMLAAAVLRWGLTTLAMALLVANILLAVPATTDFSAWYSSAGLIVFAMPLVAAVWGVYTAIRGTVAQPIVI